MPTLRIWSDPPDMEPGSPQPATRTIGDRLLVAYLCINPEFPGWSSGAASDHPGWDTYSAVLEFSGVRSFTLGPPSEGNLYEHPLYSSGLKSYRFYHVDDDPSGHLKRWVVTFHDETLDVIANSGKVLHSRIEGEDTLAILAAF